MPDPADPTAVPDRSRTIAGTVLRQRRHLRFLYSMQASPPRAVIAVKAAVAMGIPLTLAVALGQEQLGFLASLGAFTILYGPATAWRRRIRMMLVVGGSLTGSALLGALTAWQPVLHLVVLVLSAMVAVFLCLALRTGPPNAFFFVLAQGVAGLAVSGGAPAVPLVLSVAGGAAIAVVVGMSDLVFDPRRPERVAIEHAGVAVDAYESARGRDDITATHHGAATALHTAWTTVADGGSHSAMVQRLASVQARYSVRLAGDTASVTNWTVALPTDEPSATMPEGSDAEDRTSALAVEAEQFRDTALGRADAGHLIRSAAHWPSEVLHAVNRVGPAALLAGAVALALANGHVYWAVAFSLLILNQGGTRLAQTHRAVQRLLGTLLGLVAYGFVLRLQPDAWVVVMVVVVLQFAVEMMVTRNYGVAVIFLTPLALTVATAAAPGVPVDTLVADRALDTVIAVASALLVLWLTGRVRPELQLRAHARRVVLALQAVLDDLATGQVDGPVAPFHRRRLHHELLESRTVAQRSAADAPARVGPYLQLERDLTRMEHLVLGACWHPDLRRSGERFAAASKQLAPITEHPVARHRSAAELSAQLQAVEAALTGAGQP